MLKKYLAGLILLATMAACTKTQTDYTVTDQKIILDYIAAHHLTAKSTASGLYYVIEQPGTSLHPNYYSTVIVKYTGRLANDSIFDPSNPALISSTSSFALAGVIRGWQEGIPLFGRGGKGKLLVPSYLGYGAMGQSKIPPNSVLIFDINIVDFN